MKAAQIFKRESEADIQATEAQGFNPERSAPKSHVSSPSARNDQSSETRACSSSMIRQPAQSAHLGSNVGGILGFPLFFARRGHIRGRRI